MQGISLQNIVLTLIAYSCALKCTAQPVGAYQRSYDTSNPKVYSGSTNAFNISLSDPAANVSLSKPPNRVEVEAELVDIDNNVFINDWLRYIAARVLDAENAVNLFGYDAPVPGNQVFDDFVTVDIYTSMAFSIVRADPRDTPDLSWGTVWDTCRYLYAHREDYRPIQHHNFLTGLEFTVLSKPGGKALAYGKVTVKRNNASA